MTELNLNPQRTLVTFLLDRTGSMDKIKDDTIGAFNTYVDGLRDSELIDFTLVQFDSQSLDKVCVACPVKTAPQLNEQNYVPRAATPLIDASYKTIKAVEKQVAGKTQPKIVICIQTDGRENASTEYTWDQLNALIKEKTAGGWQFNFMGASIDAYDQGRRMGMHVNSIMSYDSADPRATRAAFASNSANTMSFATGQSATTDYSLAQKIGAGDKFIPGGLTGGKVTAPPPPPPPNPTPTTQAVDDFTL